MFGSLGATLIVQNFIKNFGGDFVYFPYEKILAVPKHAYIPNFIKICRRFWAVEHYTHYRQKNIKIKNSLFFKNFRTPHNRYIRKVLSAEQPVVWATSVLNWALHLQLTKVTRIWEV